MKMSGMIRCLLGVVGVTLICSGCVSLPPVVHVEHKTDQRELIQRLQAIDERLDRLEQRAAEDMRLELQLLRQEVEELQKQAEDQPTTGE